MTRNTPRIIIVGAGFAGMYSALAARGLITAQNAAVEVMVVAPEPTLVIRPRLYEGNPSALTAPLGPLFEATGVKFVAGVVKHIDTSARTVAVNGTHLEYDRLILAAGSQLAAPPVPGMQHTFSVDQLSDAEKLQGHLSALSDQPATSARDTFVVCGGGFTGVELAAELPGRVGSLGNTRIVVIERGDEIGATLGPGPRPSILKALAGLGVEVRLGEAVESIDPNGVTTSKGRIDASTVVWTGGMKATHLTDQIPGQKDHLGRLIVDDTLRVPDSNVFATGDAACAVADKGHVTKQSCQHALILGRFSGYNAAADLLGVPAMPYSQEKYGTCLALGPGAVITSGWDFSFVMAGQEAKAVKTWINTSLIYPPAAEEAFKVAHPSFEIPSLAV